MGHSNLFVLMSVALVMAALLKKAGSKAGEAH
jgi:hypothetical protein